MCVREHVEQNAQSTSNKNNTITDGHLGLFQGLELVRATRSGHREVRAVQREELDPAVHRVVVPEAQHLLLLPEGLVSLKHDPGRVGLKQRLVQPYGARDRGRVILQV